MRDGNNIDYAIDTLTNRYDSVGGNNLTYDAAGNLTKDKNGYTYHYDYENRLIKIKKSNDTVDVAEFSYDALGRRIKKTDSITSANTRRYYYNYNWQILSEFDGSGGYKKSYIYGNYIDEVLMSVGTIFVSTHKYYLHDHLSSPVALTDNDGVVVERYEYDAYGKCYILEPNFAPDPDGKPDVGNPFMFTGRELDILDNGSLKIQYNRNRYYDYYMGRWLTEDATNYEDGMNLYEYCRSQPTIAFDSLGLFWFEPIARPCYHKDETLGCFNGAWMSIALFPTDEEKNRLEEESKGKGTVVLRKLAQWDVEDCCGNILKSLSGREIATFVNEFDLDKPTGAAAAGSKTIKTGEWKGEKFEYTERTALMYSALIYKMFPYPCCTQGRIDVLAQFLLYTGTPVFPYGLRPRLYKFAPIKTISGPEWGHLPAIPKRWVSPIGELMSKGTIKVRIDWDCGGQNIDIRTSPEWLYKSPQEGLNTRVGREKELDPIWFGEFYPNWFPF